MAENNSLQTLIKSKSKAGEKIFSTILNDALKKKAESIHFCPNEDELILFYRQNKALKKIAKLPNTWHKILSQLLKKIANLDIQDNILQEGRFKIALNKKIQRFSVFFWPTVTQEKIILKLHKEEDLKNLDFSPKDLKSLQTILDKKTGSPRGVAGLILVSQMRPNEKNQVFYALLKELNKDELDIYSLEDFVDYSILGINQQQLKNWHDETLGESIHKIIKHDADVLALGNISGPLALEQIKNALALGTLVIAYLPNNNYQDLFSQLENWGFKTPALKKYLKTIIIKDKDKLALKNN